MQTSLFRGTELYIYKKFQLLSKGSPVATNVVIPVGKARSKCVQNKRGRWERANFEPRPGQEPPKTTVLTDTL